MVSDSSTAGKPSLIRAIGWAGIALIVINSMVGAGIFALPGAVGPVAGNLSPWLFLAIGALFLTVVLSFAELASYFRDSGGPVLFAQTAFGPLAGFSSGWLLYISRLSAYAANTNAMALYLGAFWPWVGSGAGRAAFMVAVGVVLTAANYVGVRNGVRTLAIFTVFKITPVVVLVLLGLKEVTGDALLPAELPTIDDFGGLMLLIIYAFVGFEVATVVSGETKNPRRTLPRALVVTVAATSVLYFLIMLVFVAVIPDGEREGRSLADVGRVLAGNAGAVIIALTAVFSIGGNLASNMLSMPRLTYALGEQGLLPAWFARVHPTFSTPGNSVLLFGVAGLALALSGTFVLLAGASSLARLICYSISIGGLPRVRRALGESVGDDAFRLPFGWLIPGIALALCAFIGATAPVEAWLLAGGLLVAGWALYFLSRRNAGY
ncbi:MAG: APC family permease [Woeseiaceae bacterium]|nr:APC family permease [Woeseiaceae bacterium]